MSNENLSDFSENPIRQALHAAANGEKKPVEHIAARTGLRIGTVKSWWYGESRPNGEALITLVLRSAVAHWKRVPAGRVRLLSGLRVDKSTGTICARTYLVDTPSLPADPRVVIMTIPLRPARGINQGPRHAV